MSRKRSPDTRKTKSPARKAASDRSLAKRITPPDAVAGELRALSDYARADPTRGPEFARRIRDAFGELAWPSVY